LEQGAAIAVATTTSEHYEEMPSTDMVDPNGKGNVVRGTKNVQNTYSIFLF
jgi:hypothetical protein